MVMVIVWFNGPSARDHYGIPPQSLEIGCNFILAHRKVHHVCAFDPQVINQIPQFDPAVQYWTRKPYHTDRWQLVDTAHRSLDSGQLAICLAMALGHSDIYVIGCDWGHTNESVFDQHYRFRKKTPEKRSNEHLRALNNLARHCRITMVQNELKCEFDHRIQRVGPKEFRRLTG